MQISKTAMILTSPLCLCYVITTKFDFMLKYTLINVNNLFLHINQIYCFICF